MKRMILIISTVSLFAACRDSQTKSAAEEMRADSIAAAQDSKPVVVQKEVHYVPVASTPSTAQTTQHKKGWSSAAKGTAIGAGSGAVVGAIVSKKKGKGAIIGGVVGAGAGYLIGHHKDKQTGRAQ